MDYTLGGDINADDIDRDSLTGTATIADGETSTDVTVDVVADDTSEGAEDLTLSLDGTDESSTVTVNDTSIEGTVFRLTEGEDAGAEFTGTDNKDVYDATLNDDGNMTLQDFDDLDGAGGDDVLNATLDGNDVAPSLDNIETLSIRAVNDDNFDLAAASNFETIESDRSTDDLDVANVGELATVAMSGTRDNADMTVNFDNSVVTDANDASNSLNIELDDVRASDESAPNTDLVAHDTNGAGAGFQNVSITATGSDSFLDELDVNDDVRDLTVNGSASLSINPDGGAGKGNTLNGNATSVDASNLDGDFTATFDDVDGDTGDASTSFTYTGAQGDDTIAFPDVNLDDNNADVSLNGGTGNDTFNLEDALQAAADPFSLDGGEGTDTLAVNDAGGNDPLDTGNLSDDISNVETLSVDATGEDTDTDVDATVVGGLERIEVNDDNNDDHTLTYGQGVEVAIVTDTGDANYNLSIANTDASNTVDQTLELGDSTADGDGTLGGTPDVNVDNVAHLTVNSVGGDDDDNNQLANINNVTNATLTGLTVDAAAESNALIDDIDALADGRSTETNVFNANLSGDGDVDIGNAGDGVVMGDQVDELAITSNSGGDRIFEVDGDTPGNLDGGSGVTVDGDGDLDLRMNDDALSGLTVDASNNSGRVTVAADDGASDIDAGNFSGIDALRLGGGHDGTANINNLAAGVDLEIANTDFGDDLTFNNSSVQSLTLSLIGDVDLNGAFDDNKNSIETLTIQSLNDPDNADDSNIDEITGFGALKTLNVDTGDSDAGNLELANGAAFTTSDGTGGSPTSQTIDITGSNDATFDEGIKVGGTDFESLTVNANNSGTARLSDAGNFDISNVATDGSVTIDGSNDVTTGTMVLGGGRGNLSMDFTGDGDVTVADFDDGTTDLDGTLSLTSSSSDGSGTNTITDASNLTLNDGSKLVIEGDQDLDIGGGGNLDMATGDTDAATTVDASNFSGDLTLNAAGLYTQPRWHQGGVRSEFAISSMMRNMSVMSSSRCRPFHKV